MVLIAWLILLRYATSMFLLTPIIPWACVIASTAMSAFWMRGILSVSGRREETRMTSRAAGVGK
jgi:hypothetical protein